MPPKLKFLSTVVERLAKLEAGLYGHVYGVLYEDTLTVLSFSLNTVDDVENDGIQPVDVQLCMPAELDLYGVLDIDESNHVVPHALFKDVGVEDNPLYIKYSIDTAEISTYYYKQGGLQIASYEIISDRDFYQNFFYVRVQGNLPLISKKETVLESLQEITKNVECGKLGFDFEESKICLWDAQKDSNSDVQKMLAKQLLCTSDKRKCNPSVAIIDAVVAKMLYKLSHDNGLEEKKHSPIAIQHNVPVEYYKCSLKIDTLALVGKNITLAQLFQILVKATWRNVRLISTSFQYQLEMKDMKVCLPEPKHFNPLKFGHLLTLIYPDQWSISQTSKYRKSLHKIFALDLTRPYFKKGNAVIFLNDCTSETCLLNPHEIVNNPRNSLVMSLVQGLYFYHHYESTVGDYGWGCAYRALQTIFSWFRLQGYTDGNVPTFREIQTYLVEIHDKPATFIGSEQWIGSAEVGYVLEYLLNISVKVLCASSGLKMPLLVADLADHFTTEGTPVMIGGNQLAYIILGVSYDQCFKNVKFLILDPHYTGPESISCVVKHGCCSWKDKNFWAKDAFYNMCLPQRPRSMY